MKHKKLTIILALITVFSTGSIFAQTDTLFLDLDTALKIALSENKTIVISKHEITKKEYQLKEMKGNLLPNVSASGMYMRNIKLPVIFLPEGSPFGNVLKIGADNSFNGAVSAAIPLYTGQIYSSIQLAKKDLELAREKERGSKIDLSHDVKKTFYGVLLTRESYRVMQKSFFNANENLENIKNMFNQGLVAEYDVIRAEVQIENLRPSLLQLENGYKISENMLKVLIGLDEAQPIKVIGSMDYSKENTIRINELLTREALKNNSTLNQLKIQMDLLVKQTDLTRSAMHPSLLAIGNYQYQTQANNFKFGEYTWVNSISAGLQLRVPIFSGLTVRNKIHQAEISASQLLLQKKYLQDNISIQLKNALQNMVVASKRIESAEKNISMAERGNNIAKSRYNTGQGTLLEVNDSEVALTQARLNFYRAIYDYKIAKFEHEKIVGDIN